MAFIPTIGQMRMVIKFEVPSKSPDNTGGQLEQYVDFYTTRGFFRKRRGFRQFDDGFDSTVDIYEMWCPWRQTMENDISKDMRVVYEARVFNIDNYGLVDEKRKLYKFELIEVR